jgi:hypothetical protein
LLQDLCVAEETCEACLCNQEVIDQLIHPLRMILQNQKKTVYIFGNFSFSMFLHKLYFSNLKITATNSANYPQTINSNMRFDENCLLLTANVLSRIASTECGYKQLLYNDSKEKNKLFNK